MVGRVILVRRLVRLGAAGSEGAAEKSGLLDDEDEAEVEATAELLPLPGRADCPW